MLSTISLIEYIQNARNSKPFLYFAVLLTTALVGGIIFLGVSIIVINLNREISFSNWGKNWISTYFLLFLMILWVLVLVRFLKPDLHEILMINDTIRKRPSSDCIIAILLAIVLVIMGNLYLWIGPIASGIIYWIGGIFLIHSKTIPGMNKGKKY